MSQGPSGGGAGQPPGWSHLVPEDSGTAPLPGELAADPAAVPPGYAGGPPPAAPPASPTGHAAPAHTPGYAGHAPAGGHRAAPGHAAAPAQGHAAPPVAVPPAYPPHMHVPHAAPYGNQPQGQPVGAPMGQPAAAPPGYAGAGYGHPSSAPPHHGPDSMPNSPQAPRAHAPAGATGHQQPEIIYEGLGKHSAHAGAYARWVLVLIAGIAVGIGLMQIEFFSKWPLWLLGAASFPGLLLVFIRHRTTRFKITARRVEYERGILNREVDGLELWRVLDVRYNQTLADRLTGNGRITLIGTDKSDPELLLYGLPEHRKLFERLQDAVQVARQMGRPMELVGQDGHMEEMGGMGLHQ